MRQVSFTLLIRVYHKLAVLAVIPLSTRGTAESDPRPGSRPTGRRCRAAVRSRLGLNASKSESTLETTDGIPFARPVHPHSSKINLSFRVSSASILCRRLKRERGIVRRRVTLSLRSAEILPWFYDPPLFPFGCVMNPLELERLTIYQVSNVATGGKRANHESLPYATAGKLAKLESLPCRDLEIL